MESFIQVEADEPAEEPLSVEEAARQLQMSTAQAQAIKSDIEAWIQTSRELGETFTRRKFIDQYVDWRLDRFGCNVMRLPFANVTEIVSITYVKSDGTTGELSIADEIRSVLPIGPKCGRGTIEPVYGTSWPSTRDVSGAVTIRLKAGYGARAEHVPAGIKQGMRWLISVFEKRPNDVTAFNELGLSTAVKNAWMPFRTY